MQIIAEKENIWLGKVTRSLYSVEAVTCESLGVLVKIRDSRFVPLGNGDGSRR